MNNYVNKQNAEGLKRIGFSEQCFVFFREDGNSTLGDHFNTAHSVTISRPDFLTAADWLYVEHNICISLFPLRTRVWDKAYDQDINFDFIDFDHRNSSIAKAIEIIEGRGKGK